MLNLWNEAFVLGAIVQSSNLDGLATWNKFAAQNGLSKNAGAQFTWRNIPPAQEPLCDTPAYQHFRSQVMRIPRACVPNQFRVIQIAYNLGQLSSYGDTQYSTELEYYIEV